MIPRLITSEYYSKWLGVEVDLLEKAGMFYVYNPQRNNIPLGYNKTFDIYTFITSNTIIISYGDNVSEYIQVLKEKLSPGMEIEKVHFILSELFGYKLKHSIKYVFNESVNRDCEKIARQLTPDDYSLYLEFFKNANPNCSDTSWVKDYFMEIVKKGYCHGVIEKEQLVSSTDAPVMPFMSEKLQEIGINTLSDYQGKGYGKYSCLSCINEMLRMNICPQWSTAIDNVASQKLANSIGFEKFFDNLTLSL